MADGRISKLRGLELLKRLSEDDTFRDVYEKDPKSALQHMGMPDAVIQTLSISCLTARALAHKSVMLDAYRKLSNDHDSSPLIFIIPGVSLES